MALETLEASQSTAAHLMGIDMEAVRAASQPTLHRLGMISVGGRELPAYRAHCGNDELPAKGGIRIADYSPGVAELTVTELAAEMNAKLHGLGINGWRGGKGIIAGNAREMDIDQRASALEQFAGLMTRAGLADHRRDVPAGDIGTNGLADYYAQAVRKNSDNPYWQATITGKSVKLGGLKTRPAATGIGVYTTHVAMMDHLGQESATTTLQGFGNVAAHYAERATREGRVKITAISDADGTLSTTSADGLRITPKMVATIGDNPRFQGGKMSALAEMIKEEQPSADLWHIRDSAAILSKPTEYFVPAAFGNVITGDTVGNLGATVGVIEAANGPTDPEAHQYLTRKGILIAPDVLANSAGVNCSIKEVEANVAAIEGTGSKPEEAMVERALIESTDDAVRRVLEAAKKLDINDLRVAAAAVSISSLLNMPIGSKSTLVHA